ncbi:hypothetical protein FRC02_011290 [Tulasnella sp. 418]|nr:hypothetical protein FRC02_011290 [Tulasnella sp. 418]
MPSPQQSRLPYYTQPAFEAARFSDTPLTPTPTKVRKNKGKATRISLTPPPVITNNGDIAEDLRGIPDLADVLASFLSTHQNNTKGETSTRSIKLEENPLYHRSPSGAITGPLLSPTQHPSGSRPYKRPISDAGRSEVKRANRKRESAEQQAAKKLAGLFKKHPSQCDMELVLSGFYQLEDDQFPGVTPLEFLEIFWQCNLCDRVCIASKAQAHQEICPNDLTIDDSEEDL